MGWRNYFINLLNKTMKTPEKCEAIFKKIVEMNQDINDRHGVSFQTDWAGNSLTVSTDAGHSHCGYPDGSFDELITDVYNLLCKGRGLSFK